MAKPNPNCCHSKECFVVVVVVLVVVVVAVVISSFDVFALRLVGLYMYIHVVISQSSRLQHT